MHYMTAGQCFLVMEDQEDSMAGPSQRTYLRSQVHTQMLNAADGCILKSKEVWKPRERWMNKKRARIGDSSQVSSHVTLSSLFCTVLWTHTKRATPDTCAECPIHPCMVLGAARGIIRMLHDVTQCYTIPLTWKFGLDQF